MYSSEDYKDIEAKIFAGERLTREDGLRLLACRDIAWLGSMADYVRKKKCGDIVYYNVNCHVNLTNICTSKCKFCAFGKDKDAPGAYAMSVEEAVAKVKEAMQDPNLAGLHIVSGLHTDWTFEDYLERLQALHDAFPHLYLKGFTGVEITHFAKISGLTVEEVLLKLKAAGLQAIAGGGAEILSDRVRREICPKKATTAEWIETIKTAHALGIRTNCTMMYGHIETIEERLQHLITLRDIQDETGGFQAFVSFPFHPANTQLAHLQRVGSWEDMKMMALSRLILDNIDHIKAFWIMLTMPIAQLALGFGADDLDGTIGEEKIIHAAGAKTNTGITRSKLRQLITEAGFVPVERDTFYHPVEDANLPAEEANLDDARSDDAKAGGREGAVQ